MSEQFKSIETTELVKIANAIRTKTGTTDKISLEDMPAKIAAIEGGTALPELENEGAASDLLSGKQLIDSEGNIVEGTIATKTASNLTASGATVTVPAGYYASQATKSVATATQATPSVSINSSGLITATATQTAGYVAAGTKSSTHQLAFQAAKTITPSTASQIAVSSGYYTGGNITVAAIPTQTKTVTPTSATQNITPDSGKFLSKVTVNGDTNLVADNIAEGVSIFGVTGTHSGGGGDTSMEGLIAGTSSIYTNDRVNSICSYMFYSHPTLFSINLPMCETINNHAFTSCSTLKYAYFSKCTTIGSWAFYNCKSLSGYNFSKCTTIGSYAFGYCTTLHSANFPQCVSIGSNAFMRCSNITRALLPSCTFIGDKAFYTCTSLNLLELNSPSLCTLETSNALPSTISIIRVNSSLVEAYKSATNWVYFSSKIATAY